MGVKLFEVAPGMLVHVGPFWLEEDCHCQVGWDARSPPVMEAVIAVPMAGLSVERSESDTDSVSSRW